MLDLNGLSKLTWLTEERRVFHLKYFFTSSKSDIDLWRLVLVVTVCLCPTKRTSGLNGLSKLTWLTYDFYFRAGELITFRNYFTSSKSDMFMLVNVY